MRKTLHPDNIWAMQPAQPHNRYVLVPRAPGPSPAAGSRPVKRYSLARVGVHSRSALGESRLERLERVAAGERPASGY